MKKQPVSQTIGFLSVSFCNKPIYPLSYSRVCVQFRFQIKTKLFVDSVYFTMIFFIISII